MITHKVAIADLKCTLSKQKEQSFSFQWKEKEKYTVQQIHLGLIGIKTKIAREENDGYHDSQEGSEDVRLCTKATMRIKRKSQYVL